MLVANAVKAAATHGLHPPCPPHWEATGWSQTASSSGKSGRRSRLHDRLVYRFTPEQGWRLGASRLNHCTFVPSTTR